MLDLKFIVENADAVKAALKTRSGSYDVDAVLALDAKRRTCLKEAEALKAARNRESEKIAALKRKGKDASEAIAALKTDGDRIKALDAELNEIEPQLKLAQMSIPNLPDASVPVGRDDRDNVEVRRWGEPRNFGFAFKPHGDLGAELGILDALSMSKRQTMGYKGQLLFLDLSYLGWTLLAGIPSIIYSIVAYQLLF